MFVHCVHFWVRAELTDEDRAAFLQGLRSLADSPNVTTCRVGRPAGTPREVVDNSWDYQLLLTFNTQAEHDAYQSEADQLHTAFINQYKSYWSRVLIYDSLDA